MNAESFIDVQGVRTRYFEHGSGPTIVFFHGGQIGSATDACSALDWQPIFRQISRSFRAVAVDRLGHGGTANPNTDAEYTMAAAVEHAANFLRVLNSGPYHVVGHSTGGFLATRLSLEHAELVRTCVIADGVALYPGIGRDHIVRNNAPMPYHSRESIRWICERQCNLIEAVTNEWIDQMFAIVQTERNRIAVRKMNNDGLKRSVYLPGLGKQLGSTHRQLLETGMPCPTLLTWSLDDPVGDISNGRLLVEMFQQKQPRTEVRYFNKAGHFAFREQPAKFEHMLRHYLAAFG
jgi:2-hydroxy-6-oxonona-2,4-dienedioate hydrolase